MHWDVCLKLLHLNDFLALTIPPRGIGCSTVQGFGDSLIFSFFFLSRVLVSSGVRDLSLFEWPHYLYIYINIFFFLV